MKLLVWILVALGLALGLALLLRDDPGYVLVSMGPWAVETSFAVAVLFLLLLFGLFYLLLRLLHHLRHAPRRISTATHSFKSRKSQQFLTQGMEELAEGRWKAAENLLLKGSRASQDPTLYYLGAAQAARHLGASERSDKYLQKLEELPAGDTFLAKLTRAEFLLEDGQAAAARDILLPLLSEQPNHPRALELLARAYQQLADWHKLQELLPALDKSGMFDKAGFNRLQYQVYSALLRDAAQAGNLEELHALWKQVPQPLRTEEPLLIEYSGHLRDNNAADEAEGLLRQALERRWSDQLVLGYGALGRGNITAQLETAENWLKQQPENPYLLFSCGRLARCARQLDKSRTYLERSLALLPGPDAYQELAEVLEEAGDKEKALQCYRAGLRLLSGREEAKEAAAVLPGGTSGDAPTSDESSRVTALPQSPQQAAAS
ncbi:MAG TPA: heme biosynthesis HemY N-terminal domain-containing protein [Candidatus Competibacteraceae bacterium]|nr:heme biosynthesis HemY N-terminal domain-containing protein [Candidatus Competibacteraceae bacterium]